jgi:RNA polymerase sigma factor (sigma-70 family)
MRETRTCDSALADRDARAKALWLQMRSCASEAEWIRLRAELYEMYEHLSFHFGAKFFRFKRLSPDDVRQCCRTAVVRAIDAWDPECGSLSTMIAFQVRTEMRTWLRAEGIYKTTDPADPDHASQEECQARRARKADLQWVSFEDFRGNIRSHQFGDGACDFTDIIAEQSVPGHEEDTVFQHCIDEALSALDPVKRETVVLRHGLKGNDQHSLRDLEPIFNCSHQTIKNRLDRAHRTMAHYLEGYR